MENNKIFDGKEKKIDNEFRRSFFKKLSIAALTYFGAGVIYKNGFSQISSRTAPSTIADDVSSNKKLNLFYKIGTFFKPIQHDQINNEIKRLETTARSETTISDPFIVKDTSIADKIKFPKIEIIENKGIEVVFSDNEKVVLGKIESGIVFNTEYIKNAQKKYFSNRVEILLNQSADLLERGVKDRNEWDDKAAKYLDMLLEMKQFYELDQLLSLQIKAGYYDLDYKKTKVDFETQKNLQKYYAEINEKMENVINTKFSESNISLLQDYLRRINSAAYAFAGFHSDTVAQNPTNHGVIYTDLQNNAEDNTIAGHVNKGSLATNQFNLALQKEINQIQKLNYELNSVIASIQKKHSLDQVNWERKYRDIRKEKDDVIRNIFYSKISSLLSPDGILNYANKLKPLRLKFSNDFQEAYAMVLSAEIGLKGIYNYRVDAPKIMQSNYVPTSFFDECIIWVRDAVNFINSYSQDDQTSKFCFSLRNLIQDRSLFEKGFESGSWLFTLSENTFSNKNALRLKGLSVSIIGLSDSYLKPINFDGSFNAVYKLPKNFEYIQTDGAKSNLRLENYKALTEIIINRVHSTSSFKSSELVSNSSLMNLSPLGQWQINIDVLSRSFIYKKVNEKRVKRLKNYSQTDLDLTSDDLNVSVYQENQQDFENFKNSTSSYVKFIPKDFFDLQIELILTYKV